jgi:hypothetical protein
MLSTDPVQPARISLEQGVDVKREGDQDGSSPYIGLCEGYHGIAKVLLEDEYSPIATALSRKT